jgi:hypothetical protein
LGGYTRQATVLEEHLYKIMEHYEDLGRPEIANDIVVDGVGKLSDVLEKTVKSIRDNVESKEQESPRERWLWDALVKAQNSERPDTGDIKKLPDVGQTSGDGARPANTEEQP